MLAALLSMPMPQGAMMGVKDGAKCAKKGREHLVQTAAASDHAQPPRQQTARRSRRRWRLDASVLATTKHESHEQEANRLARAGSMRTRRREY